MEFLQSMKVTGLAVLQILLLAAIGYFLVKKNILKDDGLDALSRLAIDVTLPVLIFCQLIRDFNFQQYVFWWFFPLLGIAISVAGFIAGCIFVGFLKGEQQRLQFLSLVSFQNSGYLPLVLIAALLPVELVGVMFIYLFLFLTGFNLLMFSAGVYLLTFHKKSKFELLSLFSPPVVATIVGLTIVFFGLHRHMPQTVLKPLRMLGDCTLPLAMLVVGANLAQIKLEHVNLKAMALMVAVKLVILPLLGLWLVLSLKLPELVGLLIVIQLAMPPATTLSLIIRHYDKEDSLISQGIFIGHIVGMVSVPLILSLYFMHFMIR